MSVLTAPLSVRARAVIALVRASRHGTESDRRRWLLRFCQNYGPPPHAVNWQQAVQKIPFGIVAAGCRVARDRAFGYLAVCVNATDAMPPPVPPNPIPGLIELDTPPT